MQLSSITAIFSLKSRPDIDHIRRTKDRKREMERKNHNQKKKSHKCCHFMKILCFKLNPLNGKFDDEKISHILCHSHSTVHSIIRINKPTIHSFGGCMSWVNGGIVFEWPFGNYFNLKLCILLERTLLNNKTTTTATARKAAATEL